MNKSNIPGLIIWGIYAVMVGVCLLALAVTCSNSLGYGIVPGVLLAVLGVVLIALFSWGVHKLAENFKLSDYFANRKLLWIIVEVLIFLGILVGMVFVRTSFPWEVAGNDVYETALVKADGVHYAEAHGGYKLYLYLVNLTMILLGNQTYAPIVLQIILLICAGVAIYFGVRMLAGPVAALLTVSFLGFAPYMIVESCSLTSFLLFLFFYGLALNCIGGIIYSMSQSDRLIEQIAAVLCYVASGVLIGFCCYLDVAGITLLVFLTGVICFGDNMRLSNEYEAEIPEENSARSGRLRAFEQRAAQILGNPVVVYICTVLIAVFAFWRMHGDFASLSKQIALFVPGSFRVPITVGIGDGFGEAFFVIALLAFGVFSFWFSGRMGNRIVWLFSSLLLIGMQCFGIASPEHFNGSALLYLLCVVLAGCGFKDVLAKKAEKTDQIEEDTEMAIIDMDAPEEPVEEPAINFIENPLPLPKKHTRKVMDYDYEVAEDDDFDIK